MAAGPNSRFETKGMEKGMYSGFQTRMIWTMFRICREQLATSILSWLCSIDDVGGSRMERRTPVLGEIS